MAADDLVSQVALALLGRYLDDRGGSLDKVLTRAGVSERRFDDPLRMMPFVTLARVFNAAAELTGEPNFGLGYGEYHAPRAAGVMGQLQLTAPTIRDLVTATRDYAALGIPAVRVEFTEEAELSTITGHLPILLDVDPRQIADFLLATFITRIRRGAGARWTPVSTDLVYRRPADVRGLARLYGDQISFEQSAYRIMLDTRTLDATIDGVPHGPFEMTRTYMRRLSERAPYMETTFTAETGRTITRQLAAEQPATLEAVAAAMGRTARQTQLRLEQEQTNFEAVLLETRVVLAKGYLRDSDMSMREIATRLGFTSPSVLSRWAVAQFKATPTELRRKLREERIAPNRPGGPNISD